MKKREKYITALVAAFGLFPVALDTTITNVALVPISRALNTNINTIHWITVGYMLANAALLSLSGYLGIRFGGKRMYCFSLVLFTFTSLLCGIAPGIEWLIAFRVLQGISGGLLLPLGLATALEPFEKEERAKGSAISGIPLLLAPIFGPILGGFIIDNLDWQFIFLINLPVGFVALLLTLRYLPSDKERKNVEKTAFDYTGLGLSILGVTAVVYGLKLVSTTDPASQTALNPSGAVYGWGYWLVWVLIGVGLLMLVAFAVNALFFSPDPLLDLRLFKRYDFTSSTLVSWISIFVNAGIMFLVPVYLQYVHLPRLSTTDAAVAQLPMAFGTLLGIILGGILYQKIGARPLVVTGGILFALGFWQLSHLSVSAPPIDLALWLFLAGLATTITGVSAQTLSTAWLTGAALNKATSLLYATRLLVGLFGSTILSTLFIQESAFQLERLKVSVSNVVNPQLMGAQAGAAAINGIFGLLVYLAVVMGVMGFVLPRHANKNNQDQTETREKASSAIAG